LDKYNKFYKIHCTYINITFCGVTFCCCVNKSRHFKGS